MRKIRRSASIIYYHLSKKPAGDIKLQIFDSAGKLVRTITSVVPPKFERPPYPDYWLKSPEERALSTNIGTNRTNWDLRYDDPPGFNPDINNQMNSVAGLGHAGTARTAGAAGNYTMKLTVDGDDIHANRCRIHNDPRVGETTVTMDDLRAQNRLALAAWSGMKDSYAANDEVADVRAQLAALMKGIAAGRCRRRPRPHSTQSLPHSARADGRGPGGGGFGGGFGGGPARVPGSVLPFYSINGCLLHGPRSALAERHRHAADSRR